MNDLNIEPSNPLSITDVCWSICGQCDTLPQLFALRATAHYYQACVDRFFRIFAFATTPESDKRCMPIAPLKAYAFTKWIEASERSAFARLQSAYDLAGRIQRIELPFNASVKEKSSLTLLQQQALAFRNGINVDLAIQTFQKAIQDLEASFIADKEPRLLNYVNYHYYRYCVQVYDATPRQERALLLQRLLELQTRNLFFRIEAIQDAKGQSCYKVSLEEREGLTMILASVNTSIAMRIPINSVNQECVYQPHYCLQKSQPHHSLLTNCMQGGVLDSRNFLNELAYFRLSIHELDRHRAFSRLSHAILNNTKFLMQFLNLSREDFEEFLTIYNSYLLELFSLWGLFKNNLGELHNVPALLATDPNRPSNNIFITSIINKIIDCDPLKALSEGLKYDTREHATALIIYFFKVLDQEDSRVIFTKLFDVNNSSMRRKDLMLERLFILRQFLQIAKDRLLKADVEAILEKKNFANETIISLLLKNNHRDAFEIISLLLSYCNSDSILVKNSLAAMTDTQRKAIQKQIALQKQINFCLLS